MEQRRIILFLSLSFAVLLLNSMFMAPRREAAQRAKSELAEKDELKPGAIKPALDNPGEPAEDDGADEPEAADLPKAKSVPLQFSTLGSVDPEDPYRVLFTFTNQGGAVRRVELANPRYRDLQDRGGYLGHLELLADQKGGLLVQVVGAGTPAAKASIAVGDRLLSISGKGKSAQLETVEQLTTFLSRLKPKTAVKLEVARGDAPPRSVPVTLARRPLEVIRPESENVLMRGLKLPPDFAEPPSFLLTLEKIGSAEHSTSEAELDGVDLLTTNWEVVSSDAKEIVFHRVLPRKKLEVWKRYRIAPIPLDQKSNANFPAYGLTLEIEFRNVSEQPRNIAYRLDGPNGLPIEGWWYARKFGRGWGAAGLRDIVGRYFGGDTAEQAPGKIAVGEGKDFEGGSMAFIGVDAQYFAAMLLPDKKSSDENWHEVVRPVSLSPPPKSRSNDGTFANVTCRLISKVNSLQPKGSLKHSYTLFTGPKRPELLANYRATGTEQYTLGDLMYYGWFGSVARAMLAILHFFYGIVGNYGVAIVMLTVLVRSCMFPISRKQVQSMAKMQELKPELDKLKEKYKGDPAKQSQAMQELYRKYNINPLAGCLPMFIQLPIFVGLYRSLAMDVELRQAPLISDAIQWCSNLAAPDMLLNWSSFMPSFVTSGEGFFGLGRYLNVLPLITIGLFIVQQKIAMPEPTNEQAAMQQKMMKYMMIFMGFMFYKVAAGLCIYFIASSLWGLAERKFMPKTKPAGAALALASGESAASNPQKNGAPGSRAAKPKKKR